MSEPSNGNKSKGLKKSKKKNKVKTESTSSNTIASSGGCASSKSPKSLIKRLNIGKVYNKSKKKLMEGENISKKQPEIDITASQETLCSMEDETQVEQSTDKLVIKTLKEELSTPKETTQTQTEISQQTPVVEEEGTEEKKEGNANKVGEEEEVNEEITTRQPTPEPQHQQIEDSTISPIRENFSDPPPSREYFEATGGLKKECLYKILVIGELGTGKTSIIKRYVHQFFSQHYRATIGVDFALKVLNWDPNTIIRLQLWDIAGQERFGNMTRVYYKEAVGAFIVFDVTRAATFDAVVKWKQDLDAKVQLADGSPIPCVLLANKCDQQKEGMVNNPAKMDEYCVENKFTAWFETSAKENVNIEEAAKTLVNQILNNDMTNDNGRSINKDNSKFPLDGHLDGSNERSSCTC